MAHHPLWKWNSKIWPCSFWCMRGLGQNSRGRGRTSYRLMSDRIYRSWHFFPDWWIPKCLKPLSCALFLELRPCENLSKKQNCRRQKERMREREIQWFKEHFSLTRFPLWECLPLGHSELPVYMCGRLDHKAGWHWALDSSSCTLSSGWGNPKIWKA